jgi:hypothetical protein
MDAFGGRRSEIVMHRWVGILLAGLVLGPAVVASAEESKDAEGLEFFEKKIRPVLVERCYECHSSSAKTLEGSLSVESRAGLLKGGDQGPAVVPGDLDQSLLIRALRYTDKDLQMPPKEALSADVIADFEAWVKRGAPDPREEVAAGNRYAVDIDEAKGRWPFTPPIDPPVPAVKQVDWPRSPIDHFVLAKLEERGLTPVGDADKRTLIRRVTYDLTGLPPSPEQVAEFLADDSPNAFATVVDRLLASREYGERWGRHWLDVVRYADTAGDNSDYPIPQLYRYRNWVIDALNDDKPYDQFVREQIAGDLLPFDDEEDRRQQIVATGYLASARRFGSVKDDYPQHLTIEDTIDNLGRAFLGLSINCARCHHHKFDPITTDDYYGLYGILESTRYPWPGIELDKKQRDLVPLATDDEVKKALEEREAKKQGLDQQIKEVESRKKSAEASVGEANKRVDELKGDDEKADELKEAQAKLEEAKKRDEGLKKELEKLKRERGDLNDALLPLEHAYAVAEGKPGNSKIQMKGDPKRLGVEVPRRIPIVFGGEPVPQEEQGSGRRQLADWLASADNPLTARVMVNRIWQGHFGKGLVPTPNDFGKQGRPPTHPELLDYLAKRFVESGWSIKAMHRLVLLSRTYQLSSADSAEALAVDPGNDLIWRHNRRRLDAESLRDTLLVLGDNLDSGMPSGHPFPPQSQWDFTQHKQFRAVYETNHRSVYLMTQRIQRHPFLAIFDGPDTGASTGSRMTSTTTLQALYFLNDPFFHGQSAKLAERVRKISADDSVRLAAAYELVFSHPPGEDDRETALAYLTTTRERFAATGESENERDAVAWESLIRSLLRTNAFAYID